MASREDELKYELDEASHQRLLALLVPQREPDRFYNVYFVIDDDQGRRDWVLRLRHNQGAVLGELTLKIGREVSPGVFQSLETTATVAVDSEPGAWEGSAPLQLFRQEISGSALQRQGQVLNERCVVKAPLGPTEVWELDRTELPDGTVHYELEIEFPPDTAPTACEIAEFREELERWLAEQGVLFVCSRKTKYRRFLDALLTGC